MPLPNRTILLGKMLIECILLHTLVSVVCAGLAITQIRTVPAPERLMPRPESWGPFDELDGCQPTRAALDNRAPVTDNALLWKELYHGTEIVSAQTSRLPSAIPNFFRLSPTLLLVLFALLWGLALSWILWIALKLPNLVAVVNPVVRWMAIGLTGFWCLGAGFRAAASVCCERERRTLEALFLLPVELREILRAKWLGSALRWRRLGYCLVAIVAFGFINGSLHAWAVILLLEAVPKACFRRPSPSRSKTGCGVFQERVGEPSDGSY
jgi:ABC-type Na+ efflux pump permease subunit